MVYPTLVETVAETLKLPYAAIAVQRNGAMETVDSYGRPAADPITFSLIYQGETIGQLEIAPRSPAESLSEADLRLLRNIASQAGTAVHAVQLTNDLRRSRRQLVTAREEERRRLRRDLHDGLGPSLAALHVQAGVLRRLIESDPEAAEALVDELRIGRSKLVYDEATAEQISQNMAASMFNFYSVAKEELLIQNAYIIPADPAIEFLQERQEMGVRMALGAGPPPPTTASGLLR